MTRPAGPLAALAAALTVLLFGLVFLPRTYATQDGPGSVSTTQLHAFPFLIAAAAGLAWAGLTAAVVWLGPRALPAVIAAGYVTLALAAAGVAGAVGERPGPIPGFIVPAGTGFALLAVAVVGLAHRAKGEAADPPHPGLLDGTAAALGLVLAAAAAAAVGFGTSRPASHDFVLRTTRFENGVEVSQKTETGYWEAERTLAGGRAAEAVRRDDFALFAWAVPRWTGLVAAGGLTLAAAGAVVRRWL